MIILNTLFQQGDISKNERSYTSYSEEYVYKVCSGMLPNSSLSPVILPIHAYSYTTRNEPS